MREWSERGHLRTSKFKMADIASSNSTKNLDSLSSLEHRTWHWNCSSVFCKNSWRTKGVSYYRLTKLEGASSVLREKYLEILGKTNHKVNWKRDVICSGHWSKKRENFYDLPDIKYTAKNKDYTPSSSNWHWNCSATLCNNSWRTTGVTCSYYKLSEVANDKKLKLAYQKILKSKTVNWKKGVICSEHWSKGSRISMDDLPDRSTSHSYVQKKTSFITTPEKIESAKRCLKSEGRQGKIRRKIERLDVKPQVDPRDEVIESISNENSVLKAKLLQVQGALKQREKDMAKMIEELSVLRNEEGQFKRQLHFFQVEFERTLFTYENVVKEGQCHYMTGLSENEFNCLYECVEPFFECMVYPDCKSNECRKMDKETELMCFLTISCHALHLGVMGWMTNTSASTQSRLFVAWSVFLVSVFESIDLTPLPGELQVFMPKDFHDAGFGDTSCFG